MSVHCCVLLSVFRTVLLRNTVRDTARPAPAPVFIGISPLAVVGSRAGPPALHMLRSGGPARLLVDGLGFLSRGGGGRADESGNKQRDVQGVHRERALGGESDGY
jgi:hypothetical protein